MISDSAKGAKPGVKTWTSMAGALQRGGWNHFYDGIIGGARLPDLRRKLDDFMFEHAYGARADGTVVMSSPHQVINFAWTMSDAYDGSGKPRMAISGQQVEDLKIVFQHAAYLPGFFIECGGSAKAWRTTEQFNVLINVVRNLAVRYRVPFITSNVYYEEMMANFPLQQRSL